MNCNLNSLKFTTIYVRYFDLLAVSGSQYLVTNTLSLFWFDEIISRPYFSSYKPLQLQDHPEIKENIISPTSIIPLIYSDMK